MLANISYRLLVGPHSPRWPTAPMHCLFDLVFADLHSDVWQKRRVRYRWPTSGTCCSFVLIRRAGPLVRVARLPSFSLLANISYRLLVGPHSPRWPTSPTRCSFDLVFADLHSDVWQERRVGYRWPTSRTLLLVCPNSPRWPTRMRCSSALILRVGQHLVPVARRPSFSMLSYFSVALLI